MDTAEEMLWPALDITGDGRFSIDDVGAWALHWLFLPGDALLSLVLEYAPAFARFLELGSDDYGGTISRVLAVIFWLAAYLAIALVINAVRNLDRNLTSWFSGRYAAARRELRILRRRCTSWIGLMRSRRREQLEAIIVSGIELERLEARVLRCYANAGELRVLAAAEVAESLKLSLKQAQTVIGRLIDYHLVERAFGTDAGREGHHITRAGQIYLLER